VSVTVGLAAAARVNTYDRVISSLSMPAGRIGHQFGLQCARGVRWNHLRPLHSSGGCDLGGPFHDERLAQVVASAEEVPFGRGGMLSAEEEMLGSLHDIDLSELRLDRCRESLMSRGCRRRSSRRLPAPDEVVCRSWRSPRRACP
jgi:hypothetical protein